MKKNQHHKSKPSGLPEFLVALTIIIVLMFLIPVMRGCSQEEQDSSNESQAEPVQEISTPFLEMPLVFDGAELPIEIDDGVKLTGLTSASGEFVEDGSDEAVENVLCAMFSNESGKTVEYMTVHVTIDGKLYRFAVTTLPSGASVRVLESDRQNAPNTISELTALKEYLIFFTHEKSLHTEQLAYTITDGTITVTNISADDITSDIVVYYKNTCDTSYIGGITYRFRVAGGLKSGESFNGYTPHASADSKIMFTDYEN